MKGSTVKKGSRVVPSYPNGFVTDKVRRRLEHLVSGHVDSFSYFLEHGISEAVNDMPALEMKLDNEGSPIYIRMAVTNIHVGYPTRPNDDMERKFTPREARERGLSYTGAMSINYNIVITDALNSDPMAFTASLGNLPIMVQSERCNLKGCSPQQLLSYGEEENEMGGYFVMNGIERVIRLLQVPRRNHAMAIQRNSYKNRGPSYSDKGVAMRCARPDQSSITVTMHYLNSGGATIRLVVRKQEFLLPVVLVAKALVEISDKEIFDRVMQGDTKNTFASTRLEMLLRDAKTFAREHQETSGQSSSSPSISSHIGSLKYLGSLFRIFLPITDKTSDVDAGRIIVQRYLFVHVESPAAKFECLIHMIRKLFSFAQGRCDADNADALMNHELLLPGHLINMSLKEKVEDCMILMKGNILKDFRMNRDKCLRELHTIAYFQKMADRFGGNIGGKIGTFLSTGNLISSTGLDLMQVSGFTVVAERLNIFRYMSHFQSVHRSVKIVLVMLN
jgi:DNA-directed RNA polymerase I subunit RPA2